MQKRKFRKVYFIAEDTHLFPQGAQHVQAFVDEKVAVSMAEYRRKENLAQSERLFMKRDPIRTYKAEGFYLVHESLFGEILKKYSEE